MNSTLGRYTRLVLHKAQSELRAESAKTYIGMLWWVFDPLLYLFIFYVVFAVLLENRTEDFITFLLVGLVFWRWFHGTVSNGANSILVGRALMQQIYLPKVIFVLSNILSDLIKFLLVLGLLLGFLWLRGYPITEHYLALPVIMMVQLTLMVGVTMLVAALIPLLPDLRFIVDNGLMMMLFLSGIFYSGKSLEPQKQEWFYLNPMARQLEMYREVLIDAQWPDFTRLLWPLACGVVLILIASLVLNRLDRQYPKIVKIR